MAINKARFPFGKILAFMTAHGTPSSQMDVKSKFWAKSYGSHAMKEGDIVRITVQHETSTHPRNRILDTYSQGWVVTEVLEQNPVWGKEFITYFEKT